MKRLYFFAALVAAVVVLAVPASAETAPYTWSPSGNSGGGNGTNGSHSAAWSIDTTTGRVDIDLTATENAVGTLGNSAWAWAWASQPTVAPVTGGAAYRLSASLSDIDASVIADLGRGYVTAEIVVACSSCGDDWTSTPIVDSSDPLVGSSVVDGTLVVTDDIVVPAGWTDIWFYVDFYALADTHAPNPVMVSAGTTTVDFSALIDEMTATPI